MDYYTQELLWQKQVCLQVLQQQLAKGHQNMASVIQAAQEQEDWVKVLTEQKAHPETLQETIDKLDRLTMLAERYWMFCHRKSQELDQCRQEVCHLESQLEKSLLELSLDRSFEVSQLDLSGVA